MVNILILGLGGFFGAITRYLVSEAVQGLFKTANFPWGTFAVNLLGCFTIGALTQVAASRGVIDPQTRMFLMVGFVGAFTTFSTFSVESANLFQNGQGMAGTLNIVGSNLLGIAFVFIGQAVAAYWN